MADPRFEVISRRARRVIAISNGKGGVGKSMIAAVLALTLRRRGYSVGLLDLDFTYPSTHIILGIESIQRARWPVDYATCPSFTTPWISQPP